MARFGRGTSRPTDAIARDQLRAAPRRLAINSGLTNRMWLKTSLLGHPLDCSFAVAVPLPSHTSKNGYRPVSLDVQISAQGAASLPATPLQLQKCSSTLAARQWKNGVSGALPVRKVRSRGHGSGVIAAPRARPATALESGAASLRIWLGHRSWRPKMEVVGSLAGSEAQTLPPTACDLHQFA